jgi:hypothetical protein
MACGEGNVSMKPNLTAFVIHLHRRHHWACHAACWVARAVLYAVLEEEQRAVVEVQQYPHMVALLVVACFAVVKLTVAVEEPKPSTNKPAAGAFSEHVISYKIKVGPTNANIHVIYILRE